MHSVSDLTTSARKTTGDVPPKLVVRPPCPALPLHTDADADSHPGRIDDRRRRQDVPLRASLSSLSWLPLLMLAQGGRLVTERRMVADLYEFDLATFVWARVPPHPDDAVPGARYFHSTDACESAVLLYCYFFRFFAIVPPPLLVSSPPHLATWPTHGRPTIRSLGTGGEAEIWS